MVSEQGVAGRKVVIDAGAAIKLQRLDRFGGELFTTGGVFREIRDENARNLLRTLPQELCVREPLAEDIAFTKQFAKQTGDFGFLSQNDTELIALTLQLHREAGGTVKDRPPQLALGDGPCRFDWAPAAVSKDDAIFAKHNGDTQTPGPANGEAAGNAVEDDGFETVPSRGRRGRNLAASRPAREVVEAQAVQETSTSETDRNASADNEEPPADEEAYFEAREKEEDDDEVEGEFEDSDEEDGSSAGEWVTQDNMHRFGLGVEPAAEVRATCATADYSVQNVLLQMGIIPLTFDGFAVRSVKLWGLVCRGCFHFTRDTAKVFCPKCGNDTVVRVPIVVDQDGQARVLNSGRAMRKKGSVYSVPKPQGGRGWKPIYAEDEVLMGGRDRQLRHAENIQGKERQARDPFNQDNATRPWHQRSNASGCKSPADMPRMRAGLGRGNPNANNYKHKTTGRKKR